MSEEEDLETLAKKKLKKDLEQDDVDELKKKVESYETIIEISAEKQFERDLDDVLEKVPENKREQIRDYVGTDPTKIDAVKAGLILTSQDDDDLDDDEPERTPSGRATLPNPSNNNKGDTIQDLYNIVSRKFVDPKLKAEAQNRLDKLWKGIETKHKRKFIKGFKMVKEGEIKEND